MPVFLLAVAVGLILPVRYTATASVLVDVTPDPIVVGGTAAPMAESMPPIRYSLSVNPPATVPPLLNGFAFWNVILLALVLIAYGYPIGQFFFLHNQDAPAYSLTGEVTK